MQVQINHQSFQLPDVPATSVQQLLAQAGIARQTGIALAVNNQIIPRKQWEAHQLAHGDTITLISATQGG